MLNSFADMLFYVHNVEVRLSDNLKPNSADEIYRFVNHSAPTLGCGVELCSCVQTVLTIGQKLTVKDVVLTKKHHAPLLASLKLPTRIREMINSGLFANISQD